MRASEETGMAENKGFFGSLFDLSFTSFVTIRLVRVLYILTLTLLAIGYLVIALAIFSGGGAEVQFSSDGTLENVDSDGNAVLGVLWVFVLGPLLLFFYVLFYRVIFELVVVVFRIFENTRDQLALTRGGEAPGAAGPPERSG
jgi:hypothetical protein